MKEIEEALIILQICSRERWLHDHRSLSGALAIDDVRMFLPEILRMCAHGYLQNLAVPRRMVWDLVKTTSIAIQGVIDRHQARSISGERGVTKL